MSDLNLSCKDALQSLVHCIICMVLIELITFYQGYLPGIFGVTHGALQFMAYEELKKAHSYYFNQPINQKLVGTQAGYS